MFRFRILLLFTGAFILGGDSYMYPSAPAYPQESYGYGYGYSMPAYPAYSAPSYGGYSKGYGSSYSNNCAYMKVIEVLDQIFCSHADKQRYSSTIYPYIYQIIDQLEWLSELCFIPDAWDYVNAAIHELKTLQDAVYTYYGDSSLLQYYDEYFECDDCTQSQGAGTAGTKSSARTIAAQKLQGNQGKLNSFEQRSMTFKTVNGVNMKQSKAQGATSGVQKTKATTVEIVMENAKDVSQRSSQDSVQETVVTISEQEDSSQSKRSANPDVLSQARSTRKASLKSRKARGDDYSDYTCSYLTGAYCSEDKYDELLYNILYRIYVALDFLSHALDVTWTFMEEIDSGESYDDQEAYQEAAITFGAILTTYYSLIDVAIEVERMYEIMWLDYGEESGSYYRAGGSGSDSTYTYPQPTSTTSYSLGQTKSAVSPYLNKAPGMPSYPYGGYISQPPATLSYSMPLQSRYQRAAVTPAIPQAFLVG